MINHDKIIMNTLTDGDSNDAIGPTKPTKPNPDEAGVPTKLNIGTLNPLIAAVINIGIPIFKFNKKLGIIIFIAPKPIANGTPAGLRLTVPNINTAVVAAIPIEAAAAESPLRPMAIPIATVDIGIAIGLSGLSAAAEIGRAHV